ncbi:class I SAM-dependent methyltransferase [Campylobacter cuniculorum]|uniref:class I SAM-dependent methyltransferase n=1 Tax=Campylobacter cuniculorum TaxID=374106 RepID=UPI000A1750C8|nr:class I SAM-dependent methyltransferase [Campylobacter cuniculorum]
MNQKCPLCDKKLRSKRVFYKDKVFASGDIFNFEAKRKLGHKDYARGDCTMDLHQCLACGFIFNKSFNLAKMKEVYTSKEYYQQKNFTSFLSKNILKIKDKIKSLASKDDVFLEIAPGHCDLLRALAEEFKFVYSVDPSPTALNSLKLQNTLHIQDFFDAKSIKSYLKHKIDFVIFRHLLEHIENPRNFLKNVVDFLDYGGKIYIEVPNVLEIFEHKKFYEFFHDHFGFFEENVLINTLEDLGCEFIDRYFSYEEQHMGLFFEKKKEVTKRDLPLIFFNDETYFDASIKEMNAHLLNYENIAIYGGGGFMLIQY